MTMWYTADGTAWMMTMNTVPSLSPIFHTERVDRAIQMPRDRPITKDRTKETRPRRMEMGIFSAMISLMDTPRRYTLEVPRSPRASWP